MRKDRLATKCQSRIRDVTLSQAPGSPQIRSTSHLTSLNSQSKSQTRSIKKNLNRL